MGNFKLTVLKDAEQIPNQSLLLIKGGTGITPLCDVYSCDINTGSCTNNTCHTNSDNCKTNGCTLNCPTYKGFTCPMNSSSCPDKQVVITPCNPQTIPIQ